MKIIGIICEYNPFHNGHVYQINKIKEMYSDCLIIAIMSGDFVQRGDFSILNKYDKTEIALNYGVDLIVELPYYYSSQSADIFSAGAIKIANMLGCSNICFGAEHDDINYFYKNLEIINSIEYDDEVKRLLKKGYNYPSATSISLKNLGGDNINLPNDILALRYIKEITDNNYNIEPIIIKRTNDFNDINSTDEIISATNIRNKIKNNIDIKKYVPNKTYEILKNSYIPNIDDYYNLFKYNVIINKDKLCEYIEVNESIANKIIKHIYSSDNFEDFISNVRSKNDTVSKINRIIIHILANMKKDNKCNISNIRLLGFNNKGKSYINKIKKKVNLISKFSDLPNIDKEQELFLNYLYYYKIFDIKYNIDCIKKRVIFHKDL